MVVECSDFIILKNFTELKMLILVTNNVLKLHSS